MFQKAASELGVELPKEKDWTPFCVQDHFNHNNKISGFLCRVPTKFYGALLITEINNKWQPQLIYCTPKLHYPFDANENWHFPKARKIIAYEKYDGTNICAYVYFDGDTPYQTFKTRQTVIVQDSDMVPFKSLLMEVLDRKATWEYWMKTKRNLSFELYGSKNPHLIQYENPISLAFLFSIDKNGEIFAPTVGSWSGEIAKSFGEIDGNYVETYKWHQQEDESKLKKQDNGMYDGAEGRVWYLLTEGMKWVMLKCKPETIEKIHWSVGGIGENVITATAINAIESGPLTVEAVKILLLEEFTESQVEKSLIRIENVIKRVIENIQFRDKVLAVYDVNGISIKENKAAAMRALSSSFPKCKMGHVYAAIMAWRA